MRDFRMALGAAVASALVVVAVVALDAVGADKTKANAKKSEITQLVACLRDRGVDVPALSGAALDRWFARSDVPEADARACKTAIAGSIAPSDARAGKADGVDRIVACLRAKGFDPPTDPIALKRWIGERRGGAVKRALEECSAGPAPDCGGKDEAGPHTPPKS
jgi:hypothetical protein